MLSHKNGQISKLIMVCKVKINKTSGIIWLRGYAQTYRWPKEYKFGVKIEENCLSSFRRPGLVKKRKFLDMQMGNFSHGGGWWCTISCGPYRSTYPCTSCRCPRSESRAGRSSAEPVAYVVAPCRTRWSWGIQLPFKFSFRSNRILGAFSMHAVGRCFFCRWNSIAQGMKESCFVF